MSFGDVLRTRRLIGLYNLVISKTRVVFFTKIAIKTKPNHKYITKYLNQKYINFIFGGYFTFKLLLFQDASATTVLKNFRCWMENDS